MIYDELKNYLTQATSPEIVALYDRAINVFDAFGIEDYMLTFDAEVGEQANNGDTAIVDGLYQVLLGMVTNLLKQHGIFVTDESTLSERILLLETIQKVQNWEDRAGIAMLVSQDVSSEEIFAELVELITNTSSDNVLTTLSYVESALITRIGEEFGENNDELIDSDTNAAQVADYYRVRAVFGDPTKFDRLITYQGFAGMPFKVYLNAWMLENERYLAPEAYSENLLKIFSYDLVYMAAVSEEGLSKAIPTIRENLSSIYSDLNITTRLYNQVLARLTEVHNASL